MEKAKNSLLMFAKYPVPGHAKTRLAAGVGDENACLLYRRFVEHLRDALDITTIYIDRADEKDAFSLLFDWPLNKMNVQVEGTIGDRMNAALCTELAEHDRVILIGSDTPAITQQEINQGFKALADHDVVLGPTFDGGYYLIGLRACNEQLFQHIEWSSGKELDQTRERISELGLSLFELPTHMDVDTQEDLETYYPEYLSHR